MKTIDRLQTEKTRLRYTFEFSLNFIAKLCDKKGKKKRLK